MVFQQDISLAPYTTLQIGGPARLFCEVRTEDEVAAACDYASKHGLPLFVLGGGSNVLVGDAGFNGLTMRVRLPGLRERRDRHDVLLEVGAGEDWNEIVRYAVDRGYAGIECLAGIPGSVGGTPVQNVGAYGQEVSETILRVRAFDLSEKRFVELARDACRFGYRRSLFNTEERGRYIVTAVTYQLRAGGEPTLRYADLKRHFAERDMVAPTLHEVYEAVRSIRETKGMLAGQGGADGRSAGSFFKNPVVPVSTIPDIVTRSGCTADGVPRYPMSDGSVKLPAAWLVEQAGFHKGFTMGRAGISSRHTLALVNLGGATAGELMALRDAVVAGVEKKFGVRLEQEPIEPGR